MNIVLLLQKRVYLVNFGINFFWKNDDDGMKIIVVKIVI